MLVQPLNVNTITLITTYKCSAACKECCFQCNPKITLKLSYEEIENFITKAIKEFKNELILCVFTGGECTLLGEDLLKGIRLAKSYGLLTRIVTNASWAKTKNSAEKMIEKLLNAGLDEINYSTGDNHQEYVSFNTIKNAVKASCHKNLKTLVSIETFKGANFTYEDFIKDVDMATLIDNKKLQVVRASWITLKNPKLIEKNGKNLDSNFDYKGCDSILNFVGLNPKNELVSCCGLTMEYLQSMKLGTFSRNSLKERLYSQYEDFFKIWIFTEGPEKILKFASEKNPNLEKYIKNIVHPCQACSYIYKIKDIRETLAQYYHEKLDDVLLKYEIKRRNLHTYTKGENNHA